MTLLTVPEGTPLIDRVVANDTLFSTLGKAFNESATLFCQVLEPTQEILVVVLDSGHFFLGQDVSFLLFINILNLL